MYLNKNNNKYMFNVFLYSFRCTLFFKIKYYYINNVDIELKSFKNLRILNDHIPKNLSFSTIPYSLKRTYENTPNSLFLLHVITKSSDKIHI